MTPERRWNVVFLGGMAVFTAFAVAQSALPEEETGLRTALMVGAFGSLAVAFGGIYRATQLRQREEDFNPAMMTWIRRFIITMTTYVMTIFISAWLLDQVQGDLERAFIAILPMLPVLYGIRIFTQTLGRLDELQQRIQLEALAISMGATGAITFTLGFLESAGFATLSLIWVFPMLIAFWGVGVWVTTRKYNAS